MTHTPVMMTGLATFATAVCFGASISMADPNVLDEEQIQAEVIGKTLKGRRGLMRFSMVHKTDGTSRLKTPFRSMDGRWRVDAGKLCMTWPKFRGGRERCTELTALGDARFKTESGVVLTAE